MELLQARRRTSAEPRLTGRQRRGPATNSAKAKGLYRRPDVTSLHVAPASAVPARQLVREFTVAVCLRILCRSMVSCIVPVLTSRQPARKAQRTFSGLAEKEATAERKGEASGVDVDRASRAREKQHNSLAKENTAGQPWRG